MLDILITHGSFAHVDTMHAHENSYMLMVCMHASVTHIDINISCWWYACTHTHTHTHTWYRCRVVWRTCPPTNLRQMCFRDTWSPEPKFFKHWFRPVQVGPEVREEHFSMKYRRGIVHTEPRMKYWRGMIHIQSPDRFVASLYLEQTRHCVELYFWLI